MITVIVPTRGRPESVPDYVACFVGSRAYTSGDAQLFFAIDNDDPAHSAYISQFKEHDVEHGSAPRMRMGPTLNFWARIHAKADPDGAIGFTGDDHRFRTFGWNVHVNNALLGRPGVAYGDDLVHGPNLPTAAFVSSSLINRLGYIAPPKLVHLYLDNFWLELGRTTRLTYIPDVTIEHLHPLVGKAEWTPEYAEANSWMQQDRAEFERYMAEDWPAARERIRGS